MCGTMFQAQKITTQYCTHACNSRHYKLKKKLEKKGIAEAALSKTVQSFKATTTAMDVALIKEKEFLTVKQLAVLLGCNPKTIYSMIERGTINAVNLSKKKTLIKRTDIDKLFA